MVDVVSAVIDLVDGLDPCGDFEHDDCDDVGSEIQLNLVLAGALDFQAKVETSSPFGDPHHLPRYELDGSQASSVAVG